LEQGNAGFFHLRISKRLKALRHCSSFLIPEELNDNVMLELDKDGQVVGLTIEHAKQNQGKLDFSYETVAA